MAKLDAVGQNRTELGSELDWQADLIGLGPWACDPSDENAERPYDLPADMAMLFRNDLSEPLPIGVPLELPFDVSSELPLEASSELPFESFPELPIEASSPLPVDGRAELDADPDPTHVDEWPEEETSVRHLRLVRSSESASTLASTLPMPTIAPRPRASWLRHPAAWRILRIGVTAFGVGLFGYLLLR
jgi:hypothetical protein